MLHYRQLNEKVRESTYNIEFGTLLNHRRAARPFERSHAHVKPKHVYMYKPREWWLYFNVMYKKKKKETEKEKEGTNRQSMRAK